MRLRARPADWKLTALPPSPGSPFLPRLPRFPAGPGGPEKVAGREREMFNHREKCFQLIVIIYSKDYFSTRTTQKFSHFGGASSSEKRSGDDLVMEILCKFRKRNKQESFTSKQKYRDRVDFARKVLVAASSFEMGKLSNPRGNLICGLFIIAAKLELRVSLACICLR
jgi:hypothetical protein